MKKVNYFDYLRIIATIAVIVLHISAGQIDRYAIKSYEWSSYVLFDSIVRFSVPVFVMISGALFLGRNIPLKKLYTKYVSRIVLTYIVWSLFYAVVLPEKIGLMSLLSAIIKGHYHLWFLPMLVGLYISVPVLRLVVAKKETLYQFLIVLFIFSFFAPFLKHLVNDFGNTFIKEAFNTSYQVIETMNLGKISGYFGYFVLGYFLHTTEISRNYRTFIYLLGIFGLYMTNWLTVTTSISSKVLDMSYYSNSSLNVLCVSIMVFVFVKYHLDKPSPKLISLLSSATFGMYLIHALFITLLSERLNQSMFLNSPIASIIGLTFLVFSLSFITSYLLGKLPIVKKIL